MFYRKIQAGLLCIFGCSIGLSLIFPLNFLDITLANITISFLLYMFFIALGLLVFGIPLSLAVETLADRLSVKKGILSAFLTWMIYVLTPTFIIWMYYEDPVDTSSIQITIYIVATVYLIIDVLLERYKSTLVSRRIILWLSLSYFILLLSGFLWIRLSF
ncbi:hypothetical protein DT065_12540 [Salicibibacter kimchii]|uniref:Uncharacterized protein n=1 Tax=Salicibibacter kimchii TaxID=2099786 RepID=A0A345C0M2_9BACI|nr:hypothetical protein DT065_12540 [Salicibibacter kimchii]